MTATLKHVRHLLKVVDEMRLSGDNLVRLYDSGLLTDLFKIARKGRLGYVDRTVYRHVLGLSPQMSDDEAQPHVIDCDAAPFMPDGWSVAPECEQISGRVRGQFIWSSEAVSLWLSDEQERGKYVTGEKLRKELADKPVLNASVLDYLFAQPHLIPDEWKGKAVFFWGTIYRVRSVGPCVRSLYWRDGRWDWSCRWLGIGWGGRRPAVLRAH